MNVAVKEAGKRRRVLAFSRHYLAADFRANLAPVADEYDISYLVDGRSPGTPDTRKSFYKALRADIRCPEIDEATQADVIIRCRWLRNLPKVKAQRMVHAMAHALVTELNRVQPDIVMCHWVDEYVTHLLSILAARRGAPFLSYAFSYFPGHVQMVARSDGLALNVREPSEAEVQETLETISPVLFRQDYLQPKEYTRGRHNWAVVRYSLKRLAFKLMAVRDRDPLNVHYRLTPFIAERRFFSDFPIAASFETDWAGKLESLRSRRPDRPIVYMPLGYFPESTTDYWIANTRILDYSAMVVKMVKALTSECIVVVKEHAHMAGARDSDLYRQLLSIEGCVSVPPGQYSNEVLAKCDGIVMGGGSVGVEAYVRGKPIFSYCPTAFWFEPAGAKLLDLDRIESWATQIKETLPLYQQPTREDCAKFISACLRSTVRSRAADTVWPAMNVEDLRVLLTSV